eukprot:5684237-Pyramimonas_sp.AAC.1
MSQRGRSFNGTPAPDYRLRTAGPMSPRVLAQDHRALVARLAGLSPKEEHDCPARLAGQAEIGAAGVHCMRKQ